MKKLLVLIFFMSYISCTERVETKIEGKEYELYPYSYRIVHSNSSGTNAIKMQPIGPYDVDRVEIGEYLEKNDCNIYYCDWTMIIFSPKDTTKAGRIKFIMQHAEPLKELVMSL